MEVAKPQAQRLNAGAKWILLASTTPYTKRNGKSLAYSAVQTSVVLGAMWHWWMRRFALSQQGDTNVTCFNYWREKGAWGRLPA